MDEAGTDHPVEYAVTHTVDGQRRSECHVCGWSEDYATFNEAEKKLREHIGLHPDVLWEPRRKAVRAGKTPR